MQRRPAFRTTVLAFLVGWGCSLADIALAQAPASGAQASSGAVASSPSFSTDGDIEIGGAYAFSSPKTVATFLSSRAFRESVVGPSYHQVYDIEWAAQYGYIAVSGSGIFVADVDVPVGAEITSVFCLVYDDSGTGDFIIGSRFELYRRALLSTTPELLASVALETSGASANVQYFPTSAVTDPVVDLEYDYWGLLGLTHDHVTTGPNLLLRFYGCGIEHELSELPVESR